MGDQPEGLTSDTPSPGVSRGQRVGRTRALGADLTFAVRQMRRHPTFAVVAVSTLALGIGITTAMFSVVHRLLLDPVPFRESDRIVRVYETTIGYGFGAGRGPQTILMMATGRVAGAWRDRARTLEQIALFGPHDDALLGGASEPELVHAEAMSADMPSLLGVRPVLGRSFAADEATAGAAPTVVLGYGLWRSRFAGARDVVGRRLDVDGTVRTIIGVMPAAIDLPGAPPVGVWLPLATDNDSIIVIPWARLRRGVSVQAAQGELASILATTDAGAMPGKPPGVEVVPLRDYLGSNVERTMLLVAGAVGLVLLIACGNVANLLLARAASRRRELSMRTALGASRGRLVRQFAVESLCVTMLGGALGVILAWRIMAVVDATRPATLGALDAAKLDMTAVLWTVGISAATGLAFGMVPLVIGAGRNPADVLKSAGRTAAGSRDAGRMRAALIAGEVGLCVALLAGAGLLIRTVRALQREDVGFDPHHMAALYVSLPRPRYAAPAQAAAVMERLVQHVRLLPGVAQVTRADGAPPYSGVMFGRALEIADRPLAATDSVKVLSHNSVEPDYFQVLRLPVVAGRILDGDTTTHTAMVSTETARHFWPGTSPLGKRFRIGPNGPWHVVVGVVAQMRTPGVAGALADQIYEPLPSGAGTTLIVRTRGVSSSLTASAARFATAIDPQIRVSGKPIDVEFAALFAGRRFTMLLLSVFAGIALVLSVVGLYGVIAYSMVQRTREMGVRLALGATPTAITQLVVIEGAKLAVSGLLLGAALTYVLSRVMRSLLAEVGRLDPAIFVAVGALVTAAAILASYVPARRAARVDPAIALRAE